MPRGVARNPATDGRRKPAEERAGSRLDMRWPAALHARVAGAASHRRLSQSLWLQEAAREKLEREAR